MIPRPLHRWLIALLLFGPGVHAAVLPDDRADVFYSTYKGGGMDITGKSVLVRKKFAETLSVQGEYFVDTVSGASIDVLSNASTIHDERKQKTLSLDYIRGKTAYTASYSNSKESDYISDNWHVGISQDMFGDLTTVTLGYTRGWDTVSARSGNIISKMGQVDRRSYDLGLSQIFTRNLIGSVMLEVITDEGFLNNPYRFVRYVDLTDARGWNTEPEIYPHTRTSTALTAKARYYLWYRAAASASYRYFSDTWGIRGNTVELGYTHPLGNRWIIEGRVRLYRQNAANFYSDLFSRRDAFNFLARDKDLAAGQNISVGGKLTYAFLPDGWKMFKRGTVTLDVSRIQFKYDDFRDIKDYGVANGFTAGTEPLYRFHANVMQLYASMFF